MFLSISPISPPSSALISLSTTSPSTFDRPFLATEFLFLVNNHPPRRRSHSQLVREPRHFRNSMARRVQPRGPLRFSLRSLVQVRNLDLSQNTLDGAILEPVVARLTSIVQIKLPQCHVTLSLYKISPSTSHSLSTCSSCFDEGVRIRLEDESVGSSD